MFKKSISMATAVLVMASGISFVGINPANAAGERTLTTASKVKGVIVTLGTPGENDMDNNFVQGFVNLTAAQAADTSNAGNFVTEFIKTDPSATMVVALYPNADNGIGNPMLFPGNNIYNGTAAVLNNQLFAIKVTSTNSQNYWYQIDVRIVSSDATLSFNNSRVKSVIPGSATAYDDIAQLATSSNRASITLSSTQASSTSGDQMTYFSGAGIYATATAKKFASTVSSLDSSVFTSATSVTSSTAIADGDYIVIRVIAEDATTTKYYGYSVTVSSSGGGGGGGGSAGVGPAPANPTISGITSSGAIVDATSVVAGAAGAGVDLDLRLLPATGSTAASAALQTIQLSRSATAVSLTGLTGSTSYRIAMVNRSNDLIIGGGSMVVPFTTLAGGSSPAPSAPSTPEQIAAAAAATAVAQVAAARAAAEQAAAVRAAEIATAQTALATVLKGDKAGTQAEYRSANINITTPAALTRLNAEVLKLSAADRADFAKIKALADKIEFDETFFSATARPSAAAYSSYGVVGVTDRILPIINAKVLELPAALRADVKAMQELVKVESFVDRVANTATRSTVSAAALVSRGLLVPEYPRRHSVVQGLASYPEGSLNTLAKIEAAIKEQIAKAEAPKRRTAEIRAKIAARNK